MMVNPTNFEILAEGDKESRDGIHKIFNLFDDDKTGTVLTVSGLGWGQLILSDWCCFGRL